MYVVKTKIGYYNNEDICLYTIDNKKGLSAQILNYGGIITKLIYNGVDVALGHNNLEEYFGNDGYFGALIGRNANRIENAEFELNGKAYNLFANEGKNNLYGGKVGFDKKIWDVTIVDEEEPSLVLSTISKDGVTYGKHCGICFETQSFPNGMKITHFPNAILRKGEKYDTVTTYRFI